VLLLSAALAAWTCITDKLGSHHWSKPAAANGYQVAVTLLLAAAMYRQLRRFCLRLAQRAAPGRPVSDVDRPFTHRHWLRPTGFQSTGRGLRRPVLLARRGQFWLTCFVGGVDDRCGRQWLWP
jgi:hypothetical protein